MLQAERPMIRPAYRPQEPLLVATYRVKPDPDTMHITVAQAVQRLYTLAAQQGTQVDWPTITVEMTVGHAGRAVVTAKAERTAR